MTLLSLNLQLAACYCADNFDHWSTTTTTTTTATTVTTAITITSLLHHYYKLLLPLLQLNCLRLVYAASTPTDYSYYVTMPTTTERIPNPNSSRDESRGRRRRRRRRRREFDVENATSKPLGTSCLRKSAVRCRPGLSTQKYSQTLHGVIFSL